MDSCVLSLSLSPSLLIAIKCVILSVGGFIIHAESVSRRMLSLTYYWLEATDLRYH